MKWQLLYFYFLCKQLLQSFVFMFELKNALGIVNLKEKVWVFNFRKLVVLKPVLQFVRATV